MRLHLHGQLEGSQAVVVNHIKHASHNYGLHLAVDMRLRVLQTVMLGLLPKLRQHQLKESRLVRWHRALYAWLHSHSKPRGTRSAHCCLVQQCPPSNTSRADQRRKWGKTSGVGAYRIVICVHIEERRPTFVAIAACAIAIATCAIAIATCAIDIAAVQ
jgi:hypothetical protein